MNVSHCTLPSARLTAISDSAAAAVARGRDENLFAPHHRRRVARARQSRLPLHARGRRPRVGVVAVGDESLPRGTAPSRPEAGAVALDLDHPDVFGRGGTRRPPAQPSRRAREGRGLSCGDSRTIEAADSNLPDPDRIFQCFGCFLRLPSSCCWRPRLFQLSPRRRSAWRRSVPPDARRPAEASVAINPTNPEHVIATFIQSTQPGQQPSSSRTGATSRPMAA